MRKLIMLPIRFYQLFISPVIPSRCRYYPSCSHYMIEAVETHGALHGVWLGIKRLLRCHPFSQGGFDPVPGRDSSADVKELREN